MLHIDAVHAKILEIKWVPVVVVCEVGVDHQTNYDQVRKGANYNVVEVDGRLIRKDSQVIHLDARSVMPHILQLKQLKVRF